jgi:H+-transporting ATPase
MIVLELQENIPVEEVFAKLRCSSKGLATSDAEARIKMFGPNKLEEQKVCLPSN